MNARLRCSGCGMPLPAPDHYHPYAACLMHRQCKDAAQVEVYLKEVIAYGRLKEREIARQRELINERPKTEPSPGGRSTRVVR
jgi:hypothetical protein